MSGPTKNLQAYGGVDCNRPSVGIDNTRKSCYKMMLLVVQDTLLGLELPPNVLP